LRASMPRAQVAPRILYEISVCVLQKMGAFFLSPCTGSQDALDQTEAPYGQPMVCKGTPVICPRTGLAMLHKIKRNDVARQPLQTTVRGAAGDRCPDSSEYLPGGGRHPDTYSVADCSQRVRRSRDHRARCIFQAFSQAVWLAESQKNAVECIFYQAACLCLQSCDLLRPRPQTAAHPFSPGSRVHKPS
jgi:hypothetical protein